MDFNKSGNACMWGSSVWCFTLYWLHTKYFSVFAVGPALTPPAPLKKRLQKPVTTTLATLQEKAPVAPYRSVRHHFAIASNGKLRHSSNLGIYTINEEGPTPTAIKEGQPQKCVREQ